MQRIGEVHENANGFEWKIFDFSWLLDEDGRRYSSPYFFYDGSSWYLEIYPNGDRDNNSVGYVDLQLNRESSCPSISLDVSLALKTVNGKKDMERHCATIFDYYKKIHGFRRFISKYELLRREAELMSSGVLTVECSLKIPKSSRKSSTTAISECPYCKETFGTENISSHEKKCMDRPIKCPDCFDVILLQNWLYDHECQKERTKEDRFLCEDFKKVLLNGLNHDLILKVGDKELRAHQDILRARSQVFESMLIHDTKEKRSGIIDIPDCDPQAIEQFLSYVYSGKLDAIEQSNMLKLYYVADKYNMKGMKDECRLFIKKSLSPTVFCEVMQLSLTHSDSSLLECATEYFIDNVLEIMRTMEWQIFMKENSTVANNLTIKSIEKLKTLNV